jgi:hypothetical protein
MPFHGDRRQQRVKCVRHCLCLAVSLCSAAVAEPALTIERLLQEGWDIAGYTGTIDNRSSLMLFRHKDKNYLVQCSILYDVTRSPRTTVNCYELH